MMRGLQGRVTMKLGLALNERLQRVFFGRIEYGFQDDYSVSFEISHALGGFHMTTEEKFAAHPGERNVGIFGEGSPIEALRLIRETYPDAGVFMRLDGKRRRKPRSSRKRRTLKEQRAHH
jgi:hypothetical protein